MKKLLTAMCLSMLALAMAGALAACNENDEDAHTHDMTKVQAVAATCTDDGNEAYYKCSECGKYFSDEAGNTEISLEDTVIAAAGHKVEKLPGKAATCTEDGLTEGEKCSVCGEVIKAQEVIKAAGHTPEVVPGKAATCTEDGLTEGEKCSVCGEVIKAQEVIKSSGHKVEKLPGKAATCTEDGLTEGEKCSVCGEVIKAQEVIKSSGHTVEKLPGKAATCTEDGLTEGEKCSVCGEVIKAQKVIKSSGHTIEKLPGKAATCTEDGLTEGEKCTVCGEVIKAQQVIKSSGHDMTFVAATQPTCLQTGNRAYYLCNDCGKRFADEDGEQQLDIVSIAPLGHTLELVAAVQPTCTQNGTQAYYKCADCGATFADEFGQTSVNPADLVIESSGHTAGKVVKENEVPATCTAGGSYDEVTYCSVCGEVMSTEHKTTGKKGHSADQYVYVTKEPTATAAGAYELRCSECDMAVGDSKELPALTEANVENGTYLLSQTFEINQAATTRIQYVRINNYSYEDGNMSEPLSFAVRTTSYVNGTVARTFASTGSQTMTVGYATAMKTFDETTNGYAIQSDSEWYKITIDSTVSVVSMSMISMQGDVVALNFGSDIRSIQFKCPNSVDEPALLIMHDASDKVTVKYTIEEAEVPTVTVDVPALFSIDAAVNYRAGQGSAPVDIIVGEDVPEGYYTLTITGTNILGQNYNFEITVGETKYNTGSLAVIDPVKFRGQAGAGVAKVYLKGGDTISIVSMIGFALNNATFTIIPEA